MVNLQTDWSFHEFHEFIEKFALLLYPSIREVNPSTPQHKCWGLPSTRAQAEGLRVDPALR